MKTIFEQMDSYYPLSEACKKDLATSFIKRNISKGDFLLKAGEIPKEYYFVNKGLFSYYYLAENGDMVIKIFFAENSFVASTSALIQQQPSLFSIYALEDSEVIQFSASEFRRLLEVHHDLALYHIRYIEKNWIVAKENSEITLKYETAKKRYLQFQQDYHTIEHRLKQHHIASFLGITPTQLSRIRKDLDLS
ncbi:Crp/Fnr family transcriptional regulator [Flavobacterium sp. '19STA2R22 D10 B1']|uniref:Crp/Fnr family transcriptional regulator n=1 Tax=Flavobacterium aerium TaxID=3037261 RepID=UPI00278C7158|nr:Crp/Fnr family transcriptional regulator [Flavobacterium sp. '19STA2R22 D10 B1']